MELFTIVVGGTVVGVYAAAIAFDCFWNTCWKKICKSRNDNLTQPNRIDTMLYVNNGQMKRDPPVNPHFAAVCMETLPPYQTREEYNADRGIM